MSTVWVTQETNKDFSGARQYGRVEFITDEDLHSVDGPHNEWLLGHLKRRVQKINLDEDWIVLAGSPYVAAVVMAMLGERANELRLLRWDNRDHRYIPMELNLP